MPDTFKFPGGYNVTVHRKQDILDCIDENIVDKEVALALVEQLEVDCAEFIRQGRWAAIPFVGNIRLPKTSKLDDDPEKQALIEEAKQNLNKDQYIMFRRELYVEEVKKVEHMRFYKYVISMEANRNKKLYRRLCDTKGEHYGNLYVYFLHNAVVQNNMFINLLGNEQ